MRLKESDVAEQGRHFLVADFWLTTWSGNSRALKFYERGARYENRLLANSL